MVKTPEPQAQETTQGFIKRELNGATFLSLEHIGHMVLVVVLPALLLSGIIAALNMWFGLGSLITPVVDLSLLIGSKSLQATMALGTVAGLIALAPLLVILDRRTRAEWHKRPGFAGRLAYKVPVYSALAAVTAALIACKIQVLYVLLATLAYIGVPNAPYSELYANMFLPALLGVIIFGGAWWYLFALAKGRDYGQMFGAIAGGLGLIVAVVVFITSVVALHDPATIKSPRIEPGTPTNPGYNYPEDLERYYQ